MGWYSLLMGEIVGLRQNRYYVLAQWVVIPQNKRRFYVFLTLIMESWLFIDSAVSLNILSFALLMKKYRHFKLSQVAMNGYKVINRVKNTLVSFLAPISFSAFQDNYNLVPFWEIFRVISAYYLTSLRQ